jgi:methylenetetrahydrofolate reductase (NADPH)
VLRKYSFLKNIDPLMEFKPPYINVDLSSRGICVHRNAGLLEKRVVRKRPAMVGICAAIQNKYDVDTRLICFCEDFQRKNRKIF